MASLSTGSAEGPWTLPESAGMRSRTLEDFTIKDAAKGDLRAGPGRPTLEVALSYVNCGISQRRHQESDGLLSGRQIAIAAEHRGKKNVVSFDQRC